MPSAADRANDLEQLLDHDRRQTERELVDHQQAGPRQERLRERQHLLLTAGQVAGVLVEPPPQDREVPEDRFVRLAAIRLVVLMDARRHPQVLTDGQAGEHALAPGDRDDAAPNMFVRRQERDVLAVVEDGAVRRRRQAADGAEQRGLAGAVGAEQGDDLALVDVEVDVEQHLHRPVVHVDVAAHEELRVAALFGFARDLRRHGCRGRGADVRVDRRAGRGEDEGADEVDRHQDEDAAAQPEVVADRARDDEDDVTRDDRDREEREPETACPCRYHERQDSLGRGTEDRRGERKRQPEEHGDGQEGRDGDPREAEPRHHRDCTAVSDDPARPLLEHSADNGAADEQSRDRAGLGQPLNQSAAAWPHVEDVFIEQREQAEDGEERTHNEWHGVEDSPQRPHVPRDAKRLARRRWPLRRQRDLLAGPQEAALLLAAHGLAHLGDHHPRYDERRHRHDNEGGLPHEERRHGARDNRPDKTADHDRELAVGVHAGARVRRVVVGEQRVVRRPEGLPEPGAEPRQCEEKQRGCEAREDAEHADRECTERGEFCAAHAVG